MQHHAVHQSRPGAGSHAGAGNGHVAYLRLAIAMAISFVVMFAVMFARVDVGDNIHLSLNNAYMAGLMVAPMPLIMLATMPMMFGNRKMNALVIALAVGLVVLFFLLIRTQAGIGDRQFLRSMIPHHAGAILVCERASLSDSAVRRLCRQIIESQQREIAEMNGMLARQAD
jgi:hypothetical protein